MKIELVSLHEGLRGRYRLNTVAEIINNSCSDLVAFCGRTLIYEHDVLELKRIIRNTYSSVIFEVSHIKESNYVKLDNGLFVIENGQIRNLFSSQLFSTSKEIEKNEILCERFINELETRRSLKVKNKTILIIQCGELNVIRSNLLKDNQAFFRHCQRVDLQDRFDKILKNTDIVINPIHTPFRRPMLNKKEYLSTDNIYYFSVSQNGERKMDADSLQYAYHNKVKLKENSIAITDDYQIRIFEIE